MFGSKTDKMWEKIGNQDPYFGVITDEKYRTMSLTEEKKKEFFQSGCDHIKFVLEKVRKHLDQYFKISNALDFGCGVGRLTIPMAEIADHVVGIDVSGSMLREAVRNCEDRAISNVEFLESEEKLSSYKKFNFIHSYIVFQHIPIRRGEQIFVRLLRRLAPGGIGVFHFTYDDTLPAASRVACWLKRFIPFVGNIINVLKGRSYFAPQMQMNNYRLNRLFSILQSSGIHSLFSEFTNHGGHLGIITYFRKIGNKGFC